MGDADPQLIQPQRVLRPSRRGMLGAFTTGLLTFFLSMFLWPIVLLPTTAGTQGPGAPGVLLSFALSAALTALSVMRRAYPRVVVGADGIRVEGMVRRRFVSFDRITGIDVDRRGVRLGVKDQRALTLPRFGQPLVDRIDAERARFPSRAQGRSLETLDRAGRSAAAWTEDLRRLAQADPGFREQPLGPDDLERVLADPSAPLDRRVGAAVALGTVDPEAGPRIRATGEASADVRVSAALDAASRGEVDEARLDEVLDEEYTAKR